MNTADKGRQKECKQIKHQGEVAEESHKKNKGAKNSEELCEGAQKFEPGAITKTTCDPKMGWEQTGEKLIPKNKTKGTEATEPQSTKCDLTLDPAAGGEESQLSTLQPRATLGRKTHQGAVRQCRSQGGAGASAADVPSALTLIVRALCKQQLVIENLEDRLDKEIKRRETERRDRSRR